MDGLALLTEARAAGLCVAAEGGRLVIRGPRRAEAMARRLMEHKGDVMTALAGAATAQGPAGPLALPDLSRILPPPKWLTPKQRRLWRARAAAYRADGMTRTDAEQEAMAELICTGKLFDPAKCFP